MQTEFKRILVSGAVLAAAGCLPSDDSGNVEPATLVPNQEAAVETAPVVEGTPAFRADYDLTALTSEVTVRSADYYQLEWSDSGAPCATALRTLNKPYAAPIDLRTMPGKGARDYASKQAARVLGTNDNIRWSWGGVNNQSAEYAVLDYFNDNVDRLVVRTRAQLSGNNVVGLSIVDASDAIAPLSFGHAGAGNNALPDQDNLHTKLTYSVADVIRIKGDYYTLLAPLEDFDKSGRIYLAEQREKDEPSGERAVSDYYAVLACAFVPIENAANNKE